MVKHKQEVFLYKETPNYYGCRIRTVGDRIIHAYLYYGINPLIELVEELQKVIEPTVEYRKGALYQWAQNGKSSRYLEK